MIHSSIFFLFLASIHLRLNWVVYLNLNIEYEYYLAFIIKISVNLASPSFRLHSCGAAGVTCLHTHLCTHIINHRKLPWFSLVFIKFVIISLRNFAFFLFLARMLFPSRFVCLSLSVNDVLRFTFFFFEDICLNRTIVGG